MLARRALLGLALAALSGRRGPAAAQGPPPLAPDIKRILDRGRLLVAVAGFEAPPFVVTGADGEVHGSDIDLALGMAKALGVAVGFDRRARSFDEVIDLVARHEADLAVSKLRETLDRAARVRFSRPYLVLHRALLFNRPRIAEIAKGRDPIDVMGELDAAVGLVGAAADLDDARRLLPRARLREYPRWEPELLDAVLRGDVVAAYRDELDVKRALAMRPDMPLRLRAAILADARDLIAVALPWDSAQLLAWVDFYLESEIKPISVDALLARDAKPAAEGAAR
ncbi:MAG TPA: transporter substrate-binding domain-containing protein [Stellaceae bacterium]|nr:transporter substrate-binding domain-containing protein [Stellaceae bacterium]